MAIIYTRAIKDSLFIVAYLVTSRNYSTRWDNQALLYESINHSMKLCTFVSNVQICWTLDAETSDHQHEQAWCLFTLHGGTSLFVRSVPPTLLPQDWLLYLLIGGIVFLEQNLLIAVEKGHLIWIHNITHLQFDTVNSVVKGTKISAGMHTWVSMHSEIW